MVDGWWLLVDGCCFVDSFGVFFVTFSLFIVKLFLQASGISSTTYLKYFS